MIACKSVECFLLIVDASTWAVIMIRDTLPVVTFYKDHGEEEGRVDRGGM